MFVNISKKIDWLLLLFLAPILSAGLVTMKSFQSTGDTHFFTRQLVWILICFGVFFVCSVMDFRFLKRRYVLPTIYLICSGLLVLVFIAGHTANGAKSWFSIAGIAFQPSDIMKLVLVIMLSKYFSRRHVEIANFKHIIISGVYALIPFGLILIEPDFGSAIIIFFVWLGMILFSGISKKHLLIVFAVGASAFLVLWSFVFHPYQKERISNFLNPMSDIHGTGYNSYQATIAVGSGKLLGKGVGFGTQSRLQFLPEYQTDFIFAAYAEEWGFVGVLLLFVFFGLFLWRILFNAMHGATNFEILFGVGLAVLFMSHVIVNVGMVIGLLPVTGVTLPFMSYGGSHLLTEFVGLGILMSMRRYARATHRDNMRNEFLGI